MLKTKSIRKNFKIEIETRGLTLGYEQALSNHLLIDLGIGYGFINPLNERAFAANYDWAQMYFSGFSPIALAKINYYVSREKRTKKKPHTTQ